MMKFRSVSYGIFNFKKRVGLLFFLIGFLNLSSFAQQNKSSQVDRPLLSARYQIKYVDRNHAGLQYLEIRDSIAQFDAYVIQINKSQTSNKVEVFQAQNRLGKLQKLSDLGLQNDYIESDVLAAINGNFWIVRNQNQPDELLGQTHSGNMRQGEWITIPNQWNRNRTQDKKLLDQEIGFFYIDAKGLAYVDDLAFQAELALPNGVDVQIAHYNGLNQENQVGLYNRYAKDGLSRIAPESISLKVRELSRKTSKGKVVNSYEILGFFNPAEQDIIQDSDLVLLFSGTSREHLKNVHMGQKLKVISQTISRTKNKVVNPFHVLTGNAWVLKDGELTIRNTNEAYNSMLYPRTGIGVSADGRSMFMIVIDRSSTSKGASTAQMSSLLKELGASQVSSLDGGGSAQMWFDGKIRNKPADGRERPVANGLIIIK